IAQVLEAQFPDIVATQPELVAHHYTEAGLMAPALPYWQRAGQRANERSAYVEAMNHLANGLGMLTALPDTQALARQELVFQMTLGLALIAAKGQAAAEVGQAYSRARALCQQMEAVPQLCRVLWGLLHFHTVRAEVQSMRELSEALLTIAQRVQ